MALITHLMAGSACRQRSVFADAVLTMCRGEVSDYVMMEGRGFGFVTYKDPTSAQRFLEVELLPVCLCNESRGA